MDRSAGSPDRVDAGGTIAIAAAVAVAGASRLGAGFLNGDAAAYAAQGWAGDAFGRDVHLAWTGLAVALAPIAGDALPWALDVVTVGFAVAAVLAAGGIGRRVGGSAVLPALGAAVAVWPWAPFAEVDVPWTAAVLAAVAVPTPVVAGALVAGAIALSPTAVLAVPWVAFGRWWVDGRDPRAVGIAAVVTILALTVVTGGGWWTGERGVLAGVSAPSLRGLGALPALLVFLPWGSGTAAAKNLAWAACVLPLLFAPPDVPAAMVLGPTIGAVAARVRAREPGGPRWRWAPLALVVGFVAFVGDRDADGRARTVAEESRAIAEIAAALGPDDSFVGPWSWGARVAVAATRDPYGRPWAAWPALVRDQRVTYCGRSWARVAVLPPGQARVPGEVGVAGVVWVAGAAPPGCQ